MRSRENREDASSTLLTPDSPFSVGDKDNPPSPIPGPHQASRVVFCSSPASSEEDEEQGHRNRFSSNPVDPALVTKLSKYLAGLCTSPNKSQKYQQYCKEAQKYLTKVFNIFVEKYGLTAENELELEQLLTDTSKKWWKAQKLQRSVATNAPTANTRRLQASSANLQETTDLGCTCSIS
jgi:hypothetical protein